MFQGAKVNKFNLLMFAGDSRKAGKAIRSIAFSDLRRGNCFRGFYEVKMLERVQKIIANCGVTSRRKAEELIAKGKVKVNGKSIKLGDKADVAKDTIEVEGRKIKSGKKIYLMFNKPVGCLTTLPNPKIPTNFKTIFNYLNLKERVIPVGRLDYNTSGLLLLTNDGEFANRIMHPRYNVEKTYVVTTIEAVKDKDIFMLSKGIKFEDFTSMPAKINVIEKNVIELTIHEGKKRIIRRIFKNLGYNIVMLERVAVNGLVLGNLMTGQYRELTEEEVKMLLKDNVSKIKKTGE